jgi:hypothetical protein
MTCSPIYIPNHFGGTHCLLHLGGRVIQASNKYSQKELLFLPPVFSLAYSSVMKMEAAHPSKMMAHFYWAMEIYQNDRCISS